MDLRTDYVAGVEFDRVRTQLFREAPGPLSEPIRIVEFGVFRGTRYEEARRVAEWSQLAQGNHIVRVQLVGLLGNVLDERLVFLRAVGPTAVTVLMTRDCRDVQCPSPSSPALLACLGGECVDERCTPESNEFCPPPECMVDGECEASAPCATAQCMDGSCFEMESPDACLGTEWCDIEVGGCEPVAPPPPPSPTSNKGDCGIAGITLPDPLPVLGPELFVVRRTNPTDDELNCSLQVNIQGRMVRSDGSSVGWGGGFSGNGTVPSNAETTFEYDTEPQRALDDLEYIAGETYLVSACAYSIGVAGEEFGTFGVDENEDNRCVEVAFVAVLPELPNDLGAGIDAGDTIPTAVVAPDSFSGFGVLEGPDDRDCYLHALGPGQSIRSTLHPLIDIPGGGLWLGYMSDVTSQGASANGSVVRPTSQVVRADLILHTSNNLICVYQVDGVESVAYHLVMEVHGGTAVGASGQDDFGTGADASNSLATPTLITAGTRRGDINPDETLPMGERDAEDHYAVMLSAGQTLDVRFSYLQQGGFPWVEVRSPDGTVLGRGRTGYDGIAETWHVDVGMTATDPGVHTVSLSTFAGPYGLTVSM